MVGTIGIEQLEIPCVIGVYPHERGTDQLIIVDLTVEYDFSLCLQTDSIDDTLDYVQLADTCTAIAQEGKYNLLETYALKVIETLMQINRIQSVKICVKKPLALEKAKFARVELQQTRDTL